MGKTHVLRFTQLRFTSYSLRFTVMQIKVKARPDEPLQFPGICVHCGQGATAWLTLRKRNGRITRLIDVPLCTACDQARRRRSGMQEQRQKLGWLATGLTGLLGLALTFLLLPADFGIGLRLFLALPVAGLGATAVFTASRRWADQAALPDVKAIRQAASLDTFSWRTVTLSFTNESFADQFRQLNEPILWENGGT
jgi:hypothetical protein